MIKYSKILEKAKFFELLSMGEEGQEIPSHIIRFHKVLKYLLKKDISIEEVLNWVQTNETVLGDKIEYFWDTEGGNLVSFRTGRNDHGIISVMTPSPTEPESFLKKYGLQYAIIESGILRPSANIPLVNLFVAEYFNKSSVSNVPKESSHEAWLYQALVELFSDADQTSILEFYRTNKKTIDRVRSLFHKAPEYIGRGSDGVTFSIGDNFILKVFLKHDSYDAALKAMDRLHKHPELAQTEAMIYDVGILGKFLYGKQVYYYIMEKMRTVSNLDAASQDFLHDIVAYIVPAINRLKESHLKALKSKINNPGEYKKISEIVKTLSANLADQIHVSSWKTKIEQFENEVDLKRNWLALFIEELMMKYLTSRTDLHLGNLGVTQQGELRYFDPAYPDFTSMLII